MSSSPRRPGTRRTSPAFRPGLHPLEAREVPTVFTVTNTSGDPNTRLSLPWSVLQANANPGADTINFNIPGAGPQVISLTGPIILNDTATVDGTTQPGYSGTPLIVLRGQGTVAQMVVIGADPSHFGGTSGSGSVVRGLALDDFRDQAIWIPSLTTGNTIQNNWIGFYRDANGTMHFNNQTYPPSATLAPAGITLASSNNTIAGNTIGAVFNGINVGEDPEGRWSGTVYSGNVLRDNRIGTDPTGTTSGQFGNFADGILVGAGVKNNDFGPNNVLSGNVAAGIELLHSSTTGNTVFGNFIGTDATGTNPIPNKNLGIEVANGANGNTIGGPRGGNIISGNGGGGISLGIQQLPGASGNLVQGNIIGLNPTQTAVVGTQGVGILIQSQAANNVLDGNVIGGQTQPGVALTNTSGNTIRGNSIGKSASGTPFPNPFGVVFQTGAVNNTATENSFGPNTFANYFVQDPATATGNVIDPTSPPPPPASPPPPLVGRTLAVGGAANGTAQVYVPNGSGGFGTTPASVSPFGGFAGEVRAATGDFNGDGMTDTVLITGPGTKTVMAVVSGKDGSVLVPPTDPFGDANFTFGGFVTAGDIDHDGRAEWVVTPELRGGPRVVIFHLQANGTFDLTSPGQPSLVANFFGIGDPGFRDGDRPALGDINGDGILDVFSIAAFNGGPRTAIYNGADVLAARSAGRDPFKLVGDFFAAPSGQDEGRGGRSIAVGDVNGDGVADLIVTGDNLLGTGNQVVIFSGADLVAGRFPGVGATPLAAFTVAGQPGSALLSVAAVSVDGDKMADLAVGTGAGQPGSVKVYLGKTLVGAGTEPAASQVLAPFGGGVLTDGVFVG